MYLMCILTKEIRVKGNIVVLDSGFCVLQGFVDIKKKGVYGANIIKNRRYWPNCIGVENIKYHFINKVVGAVDTIFGELENMPLCVFFMKEKDYSVMLMSTYGKNEWVGDDTSRKICG